MGFYYHHQSSKVVIEAEHILEAATLLDGKYKSWGGDTLLLKDFLTPQDFISEVARSQSWTACFKNDGSLEDAVFDEIKGGYRAEWLDRVAKYITPGSYVQIRDDDGDVFRIVWRNAEEYEVVSPQWPGEYLED